MTSKAHPEYALHLLPHNFTYNGKKKYIIRRIILHYRLLKLCDKFILYLLN